MEIYKICVEVFEKSISRTEMINHYFERKFYEACHRLCKKLVHGFTCAQRARKVLKLQFYYDAVSIVMKIIPEHIVALFQLPVKF